MQKVSCIVCAYNEAERIGAVLDVITRMPELDEILVVDDGSTDGTSAVLGAYPQVTLLQQKCNLGKTQALKRGIEHAQNPLILLLDADLVGLQSSDVLRLLAPVLSGHCAMSLSMRKNSLLLFKWMGLDFISGERVFAKTLIKAHLKTLATLPPFGFEVFLNRLIVSSHGPIASVRWPQVSHVRKAKKKGFWKGNFAELKMFFEIVWTVGPIAMLVQNVRMLRLIRHAQERDF